jgi:MFS family permease
MNASLADAAPTDTGAEPPTKNIRRDLNAILGDGATFSTMVGLGETYVPAFVLALGLGEVAAGMVATVPLLAGSVLQMAAPGFVRKLGSYRRWVVACAACQALSLLLMAALALRPDWSGWSVFAAAVVYWSAGLAAGPAWNAWVEHLVPRGMRASFFARRVRVCQFCILLGLVAGGLMLRQGAASNHLRTTFAVLFIAAACSRLISAVLISRQTESRGMLLFAAKPVRASTSFWPLPAGARLVLYLVTLQTAVYISGPYFTPYMLTRLKLSYLEYTLLLGAAFSGKILALPWFGAYAKRAGANRLLWIGGIGVVPVASLWLISDSFPYLLAMQFFSGVVWAAHELAVFLMFFESIPREHRVRVLTWYNFGNSAAMVGGALLGAAVFRLLGDATPTYLTIFALSSISRGVSLVLLPGAPACWPSGLRPVLSNVRFFPA